MSTAQSALIFALLVIYVTAGKTDMHPTPMSMNFSHPDASGLKSPVPVDHNIVTCTRVWLTNKAGWVRMEKFIEQALCYSDYVIVAVRTELDRVGTFEHLQELAALKPRLIPLSITPWIDSTVPLNALVNVAGRLGRSYVPTLFNQYARNNIEFVLFQSIEIDCKPEDITKLRNFMNSENYSDVLVAGASLEGSHNFSPGKHHLCGLNSPWNTFSLWHISTLAKLGFVAVSDGLSGPTGSAIEEVTTASLYQHHMLYSKLGTIQRYRSLLVRLPSAYWRTNFTTVERKAMHASKMESKNVRAVLQLESLGIEAGIVEHIDASAP